MGNRLLHSAAILVSALFVGSCSNDDENTNDDENAIEDEKTIDEEETVKLSGEVVYDAYQRGVTVVLACESSSSSYQSDGSIYEKHPGGCKGKTILQQPGQFSLEATMSWADSKPDIDLLVYLVEEKDDRIGGCLAGAIISLPLENHQDLTVNMETGRCPLRK